MPIVLSRHIELLKDLILHIRLIWLCLMGLLIPFSYLEAESLPAPYEVIYTAKYNGMDVEAKHRLVMKEDSYQLLSTAKGLLGGLTEQENFHIDPQGRIRPDSYKAEQSLFGLEKTERLIIDQRAQKAVYTRKKKHRELSIRPNHLGPISYQLQLRRDLEILSAHSADALNPASSFTYKVLSRGRVKDYAFKILGEEVIDTPLGSLLTLKLQRVRDDGERKTTFWMAPHWEFLIVKIRQDEEDGEQYEMLIKTARIGGQAVSTASEQAALP